MNGWYILLSVGFLLLLARMFFFLVDVRGGSMIPTLQHGDRVLAMRFFPLQWMQRWLKKGAIVILHFNMEAGESDVYPAAGEGTLYIKRLIGLPGERVALRLADLPPHVSNRRGAQVDEAGRWVWFIPAEHGFVKGDSFGFDSTIVGPVLLRNVRGVVVMKLRRPHKTSKVEENFGSLLR